MRTIANDTGPRWKFSPLGPLCILGMKTVIFPADSRFEKHPLGFFADPRTLRPLPVWLPIVQAEWLPNGRDMRLLADVVFVDPKGRIWRADTGRVVNGLSSPRVFWRIQPPFVGKAREASVIHDVACEDQQMPSPYVHWVFWCAMRANGVGPVEAWCRWRMVSWFGPRFNGEGVT